MNDAKVLIPLVTPLTQEKKVCAQSVSGLIQYSSDIVSGYVPCLTSGEGWLLDYSQWEDMVRYTLANVDNKHDVVVGIERPNTVEVVGYSEQAQKLGASGVIVTSPFGETISQKQIVDHYAAIHAATDLDIYIYNESELSANVISSESLLEISALPRVVGIKESSNSDEFLKIAPQLQENGVAYFIGWENQLTQENLASGNICSLSNIYPEICLMAARHAEANLQQAIDQLCEKHSLYAKDWYRYIKIFLYENGIISTNAIV